MQRLAAAAALPAPADPATNLVEGDKPADAAADRGGTRARPASTPASSSAAGPTMAIAPTRLEYTADGRVVAPDGAAGTVAA